MTPAQIRALCTHYPYYQKGCIACNERYVKTVLRPDRKKQNDYLAGLPEKERAQTMELLMEGRA